LATNDPRLDYIDYSSIRFPSDNLTIGAVRKLYPHRFDVDGDEVPVFFEANAGKPTGDSKEEWLFCMLSTERALARHAFEGTCLP
jgi:hypothetical protein